MKRGEVIKECPEKPSLYTNLVWLESKLHSAGKSSFKKKI